MKGSSHQICVGLQRRHCLIQLRVQQPAREPGQEQPRKDEAQLSIAVKDGPGHMSQRGTAEVWKQESLCSPWPVWQKGGEPLMCDPPAEPC